MNIDLHAASKLLSYIAHHLVKAATAVLQPESFLYWPYLTVALVIALVVTTVKVRASYDAGGASFWRAVRSARLHTDSQYVQLGRANHCHELHAVVRGCRLTAVKLAHTASAHEER